LAYQYGPASNIASSQAICGSTSVRTDLAALAKTMEDLVLKLRL
jgi:hypothetical protein